MQTQVENKQDFSSVIRDRHSVRSYDPSHEISEQEMKELLGDAILAPSSNNLQPWRFLVIQSKELKAKLLPIAYNQQQVVEASAIVAVFADMEAYKQAETIYGRAVEAGYMTEATKDAFVTRLTGAYEGKPEVYRETALIDGGLVSMQLMLAAKARGYDTVPMGGYDKAQFVQAFEVPGHYVPVMLIAVGKAAKPGHATTRLTVDEVAYFNTF
ncbi:nitroreductase family protein [Paenibacillus abyssi]|uniref:NAD(P)H nitroreductase YdgI n=1 Tax=Paenibacillus abyssi TaxID=1340531 RepID=A0A917FQD5_9BACL|nr:nitroreductase family protein [Paenibacillus abyssi]GGF95798.1 putative NAD(P)H nitroreductase YdgI [Paenibacillus abyssi]